MKQVVLSLILYVMALCTMHGQEQFTAYFDFDIDEVANTSNRKLSQWILDHKDVQILKIHGFADATGNSAYNIDLSERRATYIAVQLKQAFLDTGNAEIKGFGDTRATGNKAKDRKVIIYYVTKPLPVAEKPKLEESQFTKTVTTAQKGDKIRIPNLNFYNNSDVVLPGSRPILIELFNILKENPSIRIDIQGHICCQKNEENEISLKRAVAVYNLLIKNGIDKSRLSYKSFGSSKPIHLLPEKNEDEKVANRRVEIEILEN